MDQNTQGRRPHYNRGRRGPDRRCSDRRAGQGQGQDAQARSSEQVDVEQIMRDIRARIAQRHGIELSTPQIQELAARRLEAILDPRTINPSLMQQLRKTAGAAPETPTAAPEPAYTFEDSTLYESHRGLLRFFRRLLNPILKLFFNPNPLVHALHTQARINSEVAAREAERERLQAEWNALHYEVLQRLVAEVSRASLETQELALRVESLTSRVDFNDRRVRALETAGPPATGRERERDRDRDKDRDRDRDRDKDRDRERPRPPEPPAAQPAAAPEATTAEASTAETPAGDGTRRRRRRRRGRRGGGAAGDAAGLAAVAVVAGEGLSGPDAGDLNDGDEGDEDDESSAEAPSSLSPLPGAEPMSPPLLPEPTIQEAAAPESAPPAELLAPLPEQPTPPPDEPAPQAPEPPDPGPTDR